MYLSYTEIYIMHSNAYGMHTNTCIIRGQTYVLHANAYIIISIHIGHVIVKLMRIDSYITHVNIYNRSRFIYNTCK